VKRILLALSIVVAGLAVSAPAHAQIAAAIGKPLPSPDMAPGTVSVRVVAGSPSSPVSGTEVTLVVNDAPRVARTDDAGRAFFKDLPAGAKVQAKVQDEDKKDVTSDEFQLPADSGVRLMLTTRPWNPGAGGGGPMMGGGAGGMPNPRQMSGEPRPEPNDAPGTLTVRLSYDDFKDAPPVDVPVALVGYAADMSVTFQTVKSDKEGRAKFTGLDRTGATSYFAMTLLPRNNTTDRLTSTPAVLDPRGGVRMILSSEKRTSTAPPIDDLTKAETQDGAPPAGKVRVVLDGAPDQGATVVLYDAEQKVVLGKAVAQPGPPDPSEVQPGAKFDAQPDLPAGTLKLVVHGGSQTDAPLAGVGVHLLAQSAKTDSGTDVMTGADGTAVVKAESPSEPVVAVVTINGKVFSQKLDLTKSGGLLQVTARWPDSGKPEAMFDLVPRAGQVVYAESTQRGQLYRSLPFQPVSERGTRVTVFVLPRVLFSFSLTSHVDDEYFAVQGRFTVSNNSWMPYVGGPDGLLIPLPKGFTGGILGDRDQGDIAVAPGEGFRVVRPIAPGQRAFMGGFSLPVSNGAVSWAMDLPLGAFNSGMEIQQVPGMRVDTPPGVQGETATDVRGTWFVLPQISILPKQSMVMTISGLPSPAAWRVWVPRVMGVLVVLVVIAGIAFALNRKNEDHVATAARAAKRQKLLDELVELEKANANPKRREQIMSELEKLWDDAA
jgi:hypothetical protein